jgi:hypothetical protein
MPLDGKPTVKEIQAASDHWQGVWGPAHTHWKEVDAFYNQTVDIWQGAAGSANKPNYQTPRITTAIDDAADNQLSFSPTIHITNKNKTEADKERGDRLEQFFAAVLRNAAMEETLIPFKQAGRRFVAYGYSVMDGMRIDPSLRGPRPKIKDGEETKDFDKREQEWRDSHTGLNPFRYKAPHPARVLMDPLQKQPDVAIFNEPMHAFDLHALSKAKKRLRRDANVWEMGQRDPYDPIETTELWTPKYHSLITVDGAHVFTEKNMWGFQPAMGAFAGWGLDPTDQTSLKDTTKFLAKGVASPVLKVMYLQLQERAALHNIVQRAAWVRRKSSLGHDATEAALASGVVQVESASDVWEWEDLPDMPQWVMQIGGNTEAEVESATNTASLGGQRQVGVSTVGQQAILDNRAQQTFISPSLQLDHFGSIIINRAIKLIEKLPEWWGPSITIDGITVKPEDVRGATAMVQFQIVNPVLFKQERELALAERDRGLISDEDYRSIARKEDETGIKRRLRREAIMKSEPVVMAQAEIALEELGLFEQADRLHDERHAREEGRNAGVPTNNQLDPNDPTSTNNASREINRATAVGGPGETEGQIGGGSQVR